MKRYFLIFLSFITIILSGCSKAITIFSNEIYALSTVISVSFYNEPLAEEHFKEIKGIYQNIDRFSSDFSSNYNKTSVYDLNEKRTIEADPILVDIVKEAVSLKEETMGYFNPFIGRLSHLWKTAIEEKRVLDSEIIKNELEIMNSTSIEIEGNTLTLIGDGNLDLGGIAKGYATQMARDYLEENNVTGYLINAGNSNIICGNKNNEDFALGLTDINTNRLVGKIKGQDLQVATSSREHQGVELDGVMYHHLISPFTGLPINYYDSVSVIVDNSMRGDVYSTAIYLMPLEEVKKIDSMGIVLIKDGKIIYTNSDLVE